MKVSFYDDNNVPFYEFTRKIAEFNKIDFIYAQLRKFDPTFCTIIPCSNEKKQNKTQQTKHKFNYVYYFSCIHYFQKNNGQVIICYVSF